MKYGGESFGFSVRHIRKKKGISQGELASLMNVSQNAISLWELGKTRIDEADVNRLASVLGVDPSVLKGEEKIIEAPVLFDSREQLLIEYYRKIGIEEQNAILSVLKRLADASVSK